MRGKHTCTYILFRCCRITPAGAGKTYRKTCRFCINQDHPRRCGENESAGNYTLHRSGSPPQVRGKHRIVNEKIQRLRITPAGAGKTRRGNGISGGDKDHPRRCGENIIPHSNVTLLIGSPPQVRGKPSLLRCRRMCCRDHPRRCGENMRTRRPGLSRLGSPPQVRGKLGIALFVKLQCGITPAGAGKTVCPVDPAAILEDHPRRCGENCHNARYNYVTAGSPPQVRGKRKPDNVLAAVYRITPAGAGKTSFPLSPSG